MHTIEISDDTARMEDVCHVELLEQFLASREKEFVEHLSLSQTY
jgi:hypothetical protein